MTFRIHVDRLLQLIILCLALPFAAHKLELTTGVRLAVYVYFGFLFYAMVGSIWSLDDDEEPLD